VLDGGKPFGNVSGNAFLDATGDIAQAQGV